MMPPLHKAIRVAEATGEIGREIHRWLQRLSRNDGIDNDMLRDSAALSVIGRSANTAGNPADIAAGSDHQVLRRNGTSIGFGAVALEQAAAVTGALPIANGGTGQATQTAGFDALSPTTTKGDLVADDGTNAVRHPVGTDGQALFADSGVTRGVAWRTPGFLTVGNKHFKSPSMTTSSALLLVSGTAYFVYMGQLLVPTTPFGVLWYTTIAGSGAQTAEVGLFSTPNSPSGSGQTLTKLVADGTLSSMTGTGRDSNNSTLATSVAAGVHLWVGLRVAMATTQPTIQGLIGDMAQGYALETAAATAFTSGTSYAGTIAAISTGVTAPDLRLAF